MAASPARGPHIGGMLALSAASVLGLMLLYALAIRTEIGQRLDDSPLGSLDRDLNPNVFAATDDLLDTIDVSSLAILGLGIALLALLRGRAAAAVSALILVLGANVTTQLMKSALERPDLLGAGTLPGGSFPSGHATVAMSLALALVLVASPRTRVFAATLGGGYAAAVGVAVVLLDWHRPSDVVGAYLVCAAWFGVTASISASLRRPGADRSGAGGWGVAVAGAVTAAFTAVAFWAVSRRIDLFEVVGGRVEFVVAALLLSAVAGVLMVIAVALLREPVPSPRPTGRRASERPTEPAIR